MPLPHIDMSLLTSPCVPSNPDATGTFYSSDCADDPDILSNIRQMLLEMWKISEPREWQLNAIYLKAHGHAHAFHRLLLVRKMGNGKSLVIYELATLLRGVTISGSKNHPNFAITFS
jgi:hypothetical protein